jgi:hypothetical protein
MHFPGLVGVVPRNILPKAWVFGGAAGTVVTLELDVSVDTITAATMPNLVSLTTNAKAAASSACSKYAWVVRPVRRTRPAQLRAYG